MAQIDTAIPSIAANFSHWWSQYAMSTYMLYVLSVVSSCPANIDSVAQYPRTISTALSKLDTLKHLEIQYWEGVSDHDKSGRYQSNITS